MLKKAIFFGVLLFALLGPANGSALEEPPAVTIEVQPESVELGASEQARFDVIVRNNSERKLENLSIEPFSNESLALSIAKPGAKTVPSGSSAIWQLEVEQPDVGPANGKVIVTAAYVWASKESPDVELNGAVVTEFDITVPAIVDVSDVASVEVKSTMTGLIKQRDGIVYLVVSNKANVPVDITAVEPLSPDFVTLTISETVKLPTTIAPNTSIVVPVAVEAKKKVQPGKHLLLFTVETAWKQGERPQTGTLVASQEVDVGVFGESAILKLLGIPTLFLLPGFLLLVTFKILWTWSGRSESLKILEIKDKPAEFLVLSITLSLIAMLIYPWATLRISDEERSYLEIYGLEDILNLWFASILAGILLFAIVWSALELRTFIQKQRLKARTFVPGDEPIVVLKKLRKQGLSLNQDAAWVKLEEKEYRVYLLQPRDEAPVQFWIAPQMCILNRSALTVETRTSLDAAVESGDIGEILALKSNIQVDWKRREGQEELWPDGVSIPTQVEAEVIEEFVDPNDTPGILLVDC